MFLFRSLNVLLLRILFVAGFFDRDALAVAEQTPIEALQVPELDAGFHFLYEMKLEEAHKQFRSRQKSRPEDPLGSGRGIPRKPAFCE